MDFSWALIHSTVGSLLKTTVPAYLDTCWEATKGDSSPNIIVSLCGAHISHRFSRAMRESGIGGESAPGFMWLFAKLQQSKTMAELDHWFHTLVMLALSKETPRTLTEGLGSMETPSNSAAAPDETEPAQEAPKTYRAQTPFGRHFDQLLTAAKGEIVEADRTTSAFYCPRLAEYLVRNLMPLAPLWSQIISNQVASNAAVESYMRIVKKNILRGRTRLHPCEFIRRLNNDEIARVKMDSIPTRPAPRGRKWKKSLLHNPDQQEEQRAKRNPTADRPSWYARTRPPSCTLRPESCKLRAGKKQGKKGRRRNSVSPSKMLSSRVRRLSRGAPSSWTTTPSSHWPLVSG